ncbi:MAG: hypothetical protein IJ133_04715 [Clostridia bacterium]|nr:hypothetical protein [Clostridia bacterium]
MNKRMKRLTGLVVAMVLALTSLLGTSAFARAQVDGKYTTLTNSAQLCAYLFKNYNQSAVGSVSITQGVVKYSNDNYNEDYLNGGQHMPFRQYTDRLSGSEDLNNPEIPVYLVAIAGTEVIGGHANNSDACLTTGFNLPNQYERSVRNIIMQNVPKGASLFLTGHSLGGMLAQQVCADKTIQDNYDILYTVTFGSPCVKGETGFMGTVSRLCDKHDYVTYTSGNVLENFSKDLLDDIGNPMGTYMGASYVVTRDGGYSWHLELNSVHSAHMSYINEQTWGDVDVVGIPDGFHVLTLDKSTCQFFKTYTKSNRGLTGKVLYNGGGAKNIINGVEVVAQNIK